MNNNLITQINNSYPDSYLFSNDLSVVKENEGCLSPVLNPVFHEAPKEILDLKTKVISILDTEISGVQQQINGEESINRKLKIATIALLVVSVAFVILLAMVSVFFVIPFTFSAFGGSLLHCARMDCRRNRKPKMVNSEYLTELYGKHWTAHKTSAVRRLNLWENAKACLEKHDKYPEWLKKEPNHSYTIESDKCCIAGVVVPARQDQEKYQHEQFHSLFQCQIESLEQEKKRVEDFFHTITTDDEILQYMKEQIQMGGKERLLKLFQDPQPIVDAMVEMLLKRKVGNDPTTLIQGYA